MAVGGRCGLGLLVAAVERGGGTSERFEHDDLLVGQIVQDCPIEKHVRGRHEVLDEGEYAEGCEIGEINVWGWQYLN